jgi:tetratricopeptide (TPR) repeat protein
MTPFLILCPGHQKSDRRSHPKPSGRLSGGAGTSPVGQPQQVPIWHVPPMRNPYFTGRDEFLTRLHEILVKGGRALPQVAISGLSGIGKTQTVLEYVYLYRDEYQYVLWVQGGSRKRLTLSLSELVDTLHVSVTGERNLTHLIESIQRWLREHREWLLVLDEVDDLSVISSMLRLGGHVLLTTHSQVINDTASDAGMQLLELGSMTLQEGILFLLHRSRPLAMSTSLENFALVDREAAQAIVERLGGLPFALDRVGHYIASMRIGLSEYDRRYRRNEHRWLREAYRPTAANWRFSFRWVEQADPAAYDLLRLCAFLHHDAIPEQLLQEGADDLPPALRKQIQDDFDFDEVVEKLFRYSLVRRDGGTLTMHPLVQVALRESLGSEEQRVWAERAVSLVNRAFPLANDDNQETCERYLAHAKACARLIVLCHLAMLDAAYLLDKIGYYFAHCGHYEEADALYKQALLMCEREQKSGESDVAVSLDGVANSYRAKGRHEDADDLKQRALRIREQKLGPEHPHLVVVLRNYILVLQKADKQAQAEELLVRLNHLQAGIQGVQT